MDDKTKKELGLGKKQILTGDYDIMLAFDRNVVKAEIRKRQLDSTNKYEDFTDDELDKVIEDINDISDWRHYKRLMKKLRKDE